MGNCSVGNTCIALHYCPAAQLGQDVEQGLDNGLKQWKHLLAPGYLCYHYRIVLHLLHLALAQLTRTNVCRYTDMCINNGFRGVCAETLTEFAWA